MNSYKCCKINGLEYKQLTSLSSLLRLVGDESRLKILYLLRQGQHCVCEVEKHLHLSQSLISHHLKDLKKARLITDERKGQWVYYSLTEKGKDITTILFKLSIKELKV